MGLGMCAGGFGGCIGLGTGNGDLVAVLVLVLVLEDLEAALGLALWWRILSLFRVWHLC